jgi:hypothetical protein
MMGINPTGARLHRVPTSIRKLIVAFATRVVKTGLLKRFMLKNEYCALKD